MDNSQKNFLKQKEFSRLTNLSRKALLLYEKRELLKPHYIDESNGYRFYSSEEVERALRISFLKNFGLSLNEIENIIQENCTLEKCLQNNNTIFKLEKQLRTIQNSINLYNIIIEHNDILREKLIFKTLFDRRVISIESWGNSKSILTSFNILYREINKLSLPTEETPFTIYLEDSTEKKLHYKACVPTPVYTDLNHGDINIETIPAYRIASLIHFGNYELLSNKYGTLKELLKKENRPFQNIFFEIYLTSTEKFFNDTSSSVTEIGVVLQ